MGKKLVVYMRVSTDKQITDSQEKAIADWLNKNPGVRAVKLTDIASGSTDKRPQFQRLRRAVKAGKVRKVVFYRLSRLGRNVTDVIKFLKLCIKTKTEIVSLTEKLDLNSAMGRAMIYIIAVFDQLTREIISENTKLGLAAAKLRNKDNPNWRLGGRLKNSSRPETREKAAQIWRMLQEGESIMKIKRICHVGKATIYKIRKYKGVLPADEQLATGNN